MSLWKRGFTTWEQFAYDLQRNDPDAYLPFTGQKRSELIDVLWEPLFRNKYFFTKCLPQWRHVIPTIYGIVDQGRFIHESQSELIAGSRMQDPADPKSMPELESSAKASEVIKSLLNSLGELVLKPVGGAVGAGIISCSWDGSKYILNGDEVNEDDFESAVNSLDDYIATQFVQQAEYLSRLYPKSTNSLRVMTLFDDSSKEPLIPIAVQRIGTERSKPVDNWSRGGLSAEVDVDTGVIGPAVRITTAGEREVYEEHPTTGTKIKGCRIPNWPDICRTLRLMAKDVPMVRWIGWDILVTNKTEPCFMVFEGNHSPGVQSLQVHRGLLKNMRIQRYFKRTQII